MTTAYAPRLYRRGDLLTPADLTAAGVEPGDLDALGLAGDATAEVVSAHNFHRDGSLLGLRVAGMTRMVAANLLPVVHLQGVGDVEGVPAGDLVPGDRIMWNYGFVTVVTAVRQVSARFVEIDQDGTRDYAGQSSTRRLRTDRLVAKATS